MESTDLRKELKRPDEFVSIVGRIVHWIETNAQLALTMAIAACLFVMAFLGWSFYQGKQDLKAADAFAKTMKLYPGAKSNDLDSPESPEAPKGDDWARLSEELSSFLKSYGHSSLAPTAHLYRGRALAHMGKFEEAAKDYRDAASGFPSDTKILAKEGEAFVLTETGKFEDARKIWRSLADDPKNPLREFHLWNLGLCLERAGKNADALAAFQEFETKYQNSALIERVRGRLAALRLTPAKQ